MKIEMIGELVEGKTYHVAVGDEQHQPTAHIVREIKKKLIVEHPRISFVVTPYYIKIGTKPGETK